MCIVEEEIKLAVPTLNSQSLRTTNTTEFYNICNEN